MRGSLVCYFSQGTLILAPSFIKVKLYFMEILYTDINIMLTLHNKSLRSNKLNA